MECDDVAQSPAPCSGEGGNSLASGFGMFLNERLEGLRPVKFKACCKDARYKQNGGIRLRAQQEGSSVTRAVCSTMATETRVL
jgi:hypothetical protein